MLPPAMDSVYDFEDVRCFAKPENMPVFWVEMAGLSNCDDRYYIKREDSDVVVCEYIISGTGVLHVNGQTYHPSSGDVYILPEHSNHEYYPSEGATWVKLFFNLHGTGITAMLEAFGIKNEVVFSKCEEVQVLFEEIFRKTREELPDSVIMEECSALFIRFLMRLQDKIDNAGQVKDEALKLKEFIEQNIHRELTVKEISNAIFRSPDYCNKLLKRRYNITPYAYYTELRIENAKALLRHTALPIREISERLGYKNSQYFSKQFHHVTGMTPSAYRRAESGM